MGEVVSPKQLIRLPPRDYTELSNDPRIAQFRDNFDYTEQKDFENLQRAKMQQEQVRQAAREGSGGSMSEVRAWTSRPMSEASLHVPSNVSVHHMSDVASVHHMSDGGGANDANGDGAAMVVEQPELREARRDQHVGGLAREAAVLFGSTLQVPAATPNEGNAKVGDLTSVVVETPKLCPRYIARVLRGVKVGPSPAWLVRHLTTINQPSINNVVDITNFVLHEVGQPLHAFDLNKLNGGIVVRRAAAGEKILALDAQTYTLDAEDLVIADSEHTAHDVDQFVVQERVTRPAGSSTVVVRLATERAVVDGEPVPPHGVDPDESFVLGVGTLEIRKNHHLLYQAYALAASRGITLPMLYLVGRVGWLADATVHLLTLDPAVAPRVRLLGARTDRELAWLYEHCRYSVFPSYAEGWGLPVGESAAHGKVCITTDRSSIPEVVGACAQYVSPFDAAALLDRMVELADDATLARLEADIARQFTARTWDSVFADLCAAIGVHAR